VVSIFISSAVIPRTSRASPCLLMWFLAIYPRVLVVVASRIVVASRQFRLSRQWPVGDGGMRGVRLVSSGGSIHWSNHLLLHPDLLRFVGELVFIEDFGGAGITVSQCLWTAHRFDRTGSPYARHIICSL
jgi:hypothetical protein